MARLTLRLPESLHETLAERAQTEGISLNQYLVYTLTRTAAVEGIAAQRARFEALRSRFPQEEAEQALTAVLAARRSGGPRLDNRGVRPPR